VERAIVMAAAMVAVEGGLVELDSVRVGWVMASVVAVRMSAVHLAGCGPGCAAPAIAVVGGRRGLSSVSGGRFGRVVVTAAGKRRLIRLDGRDWVVGLVMLEP
jgi:hypothetical protein